MGAYERQRAHARVQVQIPVEIKSGSRVAMGLSENISVGGMLIVSNIPVQTASDVMLMFNLKTECTLRAEAVVRHSRKDRFGVEFQNLSQAAYEALTDFCRTVQGHTRRSGRISKRMLVILRNSAIGSSEEVAETMTLSRNGGLLACRASFRIGDRLDLFWPDEKRTAAIEIVSTRPNLATVDLLELGFRFVSDQNFWRIEFPPASEYNP